MYVGPHLDYCDGIYDNPAVVNDFDSSLTLPTSMECLEKLQYQAALAVTGCWKGTNRGELDEELGWESLAHRRWARRITHFFKIIHTKSSGCMILYLEDVYPFMDLVVLTLSMKSDSIQINIEKAFSLQVQVQVQVLRHGIILLTIFVIVHL